MPQEHYAANQSRAVNSTESWNGLQRLQRAMTGLRRLQSSADRRVRARPRSVAKRETRCAWASGAKTRCLQVRHRSGYCSISRRRRSAKRKREARKFEKPQRLQKIVTKSWMRGTEPKNGFSGKKRDYFRFSGSASFCSSFAATISSAALTASSKDKFVESRTTASDAAFSGESARLRSRSSRA
jgi:hypothetical protein